MSAAASPRTARSQPKNTIQRLSQRLLVDRQRLPGKLAAMSLLERLAATSNIVPETASLAVVERYQPTHVNLSAAGITAAAQDSKHSAIVDEAVAWAQQAVGKGGNRKLVATRAVERLAVEFAEAMSKRIQGQVSIETDGRLAYKKRPTIDKARQVVAALEEKGIGKERILVKIPATWEGIEAARILRSKSNIACQMTLVFGLHQVAACADAGAKVISPAVGRISDAHRKKQGVEHFAIEADPGVLAVMGMHNYLRSHSYDTEVMPCTFRTLEQVMAVAACEHLALPLKLLEALDTTAESDSATFAPKQGASLCQERLSIDSKRFTSMHAKDSIAREKLQSGVRNLSWAVVSQQNQLCDWICNHQDSAAETSTAALFKIWDFDGDGYIDREEWGGLEEVFNALDRDNNGRISLEEMARGLGAPFSAEES